MHRLAAEWTRAGRKVTPTALRSALGHGSYSTITSALRDWKGERQAPTNALAVPVTIAHPPALPDDTHTELRLLREALEAATSAMEALRRDAADQLEQAYVRYETLQRRMLVEVDTARQRVADIQAHSQAALDDARARETILRQQLDTFREKAARLQGQLDALGEGHNKPA